jgi:hypothetical protein
MKIEETLIVMKNMTVLYIESKGVRDGDLYTFDVTGEDLILENKIKKKIVHHPKLLSWLQNAWSSMTFNSTSYRALNVITRKIGSLCTPKRMFFFFFSTR